MTEPTGGEASSQTPHRESFYRDFLRLAGPFWLSWWPAGLFIGMGVLTLGQVFFNIRINIWSKSLFDSLELKSMDRFMTQIGWLAAILACLMTVNATHLRVKRRMQLSWRQWLTHRLLDEWMAKGRHYQVTFMPGQHDNPDGRIAEDIRVTTEVALELLHSMSYCLLLLVGYIQILWVLSGWLPVTVGDQEFSIPGHMVWVGLLYAGFGSALAFMFGRPLVRAVDRRQTSEANFRFSLVRSRENSEAIALLHGEPDEQRRLLAKFKGIREAWNYQTQALTRIFVFSSGFSVLHTVFPLLVTAPRYISGAITLGVLMQTAQAFQQLVQALSWPVDNMARVAEWRASVERVLNLHDALESVKEGEAQAEDGHIKLATSEQPVLEFRDLVITAPSAEPSDAPLNLVITQGERVLISGDPGAAVRMFKVVSGLWPWGSGTVLLPANDGVVFMPQRPYMPIGPLREAIAFPMDSCTCSDEAMVAALHRVGLSNLAERLDQIQTWEQVLTLGEQQRLGFARLLLHRGTWIFLQEATDALDPHGEQEMMRLLAEEFPDATILTVGYHTGLEAHHQRRLVLELTPGQVNLVQDAPLKPASYQHGDPVV